MGTDNQAQIDDWNGAIGQNWVGQQELVDAVVRPFGQAALDAAAPQAGERVIDVGCGCGETTLALARRVGPTGSVLGIDVSRPMLAVARASALRAGLDALAFLEADASDAALPAVTDLLYSRFGIMFFAAPAAALAHLRRTLRPGGRCVFVCWRAPRDNPWAMAPLVAVRQVLGVTQPPMDPHAPGPFAFADDAWVRGLLGEAGFDAIRIERFDAPVRLGETPRAAAEGALRIGPTSRLAREVGMAHAPTMIGAIEAALAPFAAADRSVSLNGSSWIVSASNPQGR